VALQDFNVGYWGTTFLALGFLALGALVMYGTDQKLSSGSVEFASQLIGMYTTNIGQWAFPLIALAAFTTMFSTLLTCLDAFPRTLRRATTLIFPNTEHRKYHKNIYWIWIISTVIGTSVILLYFLSSMKEMVDLATTISFVIAPILATLNYLVMNDSQIPESFRQPKWLKISNLISIGLLLLFSLWFLLR
jgi:Mn2+/Fe2+ NRAMP family transporter